MSYEQAVRELYFWQYSNTGCFHNMLFDLMAKADANNFARLVPSFPNECMAYIDWSGAGDGGNELFRKHGLMK